MGSPAGRESGGWLQRPYPGRPALWPAVITIGLLALGFRRRAPQERLRRSFEARETGDTRPRGRWASTPSEIPVRGWKDVLLKVYENIAEHRVIAIAAGVTFYVILALFPAIAALVALYGIFADPSTIGKHLNALSGIMPGGALDIIGAQLGRVVAMIVLPIALDYLGLATATASILRIARWPLLLIVVSLAIAVIYRYGPSREEAQWHWISWGSAFAAIAWLAASILFSWYAESFANYNKTYGSLGAAIGFMTWIWMSTIVVLIGAELNAEMEHQTVRDTTTGAAKPMG